MAAESFTVIGGRYRDTTFEDLADEAERHGPFSDWDEAYACWSDLSWRHVDDCLARYVIRDRHGHLCAKDPALSKD